MGKDNLYTNYKEQNVLLQVNHAFNLLGCWEWDLIKNKVYWTDGTFHLKAAPVESVKLPQFEETIQQVHEDDRELVKANFDALKQKQEVSFEYRKLNEENKYRIIKLTSLLIVNEQPVYLRVCSQDVTTESELSTSLQLKNKELERSNNDLASFSYVASHDLQEPLRKIQTFSQRLRETEHQQLSEQGKNYFVRMENAALRMQQLIEDLLSFSRTSNAPKLFEEVDLTEMLNEVRSSLKDTIDEKQAVIEYNLLPTLKVIPFQLKQLFENLLLNSLKYSKTDVSPHIIIKAYMVLEGKEAEEERLTPDDYYKITFTDNGIGFEQQYAEKVFELFQRLHGKHEYPGSGVGLSICKKVMENHNGNITAQSEPGKGATFTVLLPKYQ